MISSVYFTIYWSISFKRIIKKINLTEMEIGDILDELENKGQQPA